MSISFKEEIRKTSGSVALLSTPFFVESDGDNDGSEGRKALRYEAINGSQNSDEVRLVIL